jgi:hypothetical protein
MLDILSYTDLKKYRCGSCGEDHILAPGRVVTVASHATNDGEPCQDAPELGGTPLYQTTEKEREQNFELLMASDE